MSKEGERTGWKRRAVLATASEFRTNRSAAVRNSRLSLSVSGGGGSIPRIIPLPSPDHAPYQVNKHLGSVNPSMGPPWRRCRQSKAKKTPPPCVCSSAICIGEIRLWSSTNLPGRRLLRGALTTVLNASLLLSQKATALRAGPPPSSFP